MTEKLVLLQGIDKPYRFRTCTYKLKVLSQLQAKPLSLQAAWLSQLRAAARREKLCPDTKNMRPPCSTEDAPAPCEPPTSSPASSTRDYAYSSPAESSQVAHATAHLTISEGVLPNPTIVGVGLSPDSGRRDSTSSVASNGFRALRRLLEDRLSVSEAGETRARNPTSRSTEQIG